MTELEFIRSLQRQFPARPPVETGIGDDGAVIAGSVSQTVMVTDILLEGTHFDFATASADQVGQKAMRVSLSDLAAMAAEPVAAFVSLALPQSRLQNSPDFLTQLYEGIGAAAREFSVTVAGGDTTAWNGPFAINVCMLGYALNNRPVLRRGAVPGDRVFVTGRLGGSLTSGRHLTFRPRLAESRWLASTVDLHCMMDISDGLALDLHRLVEASECGAVIEAECIPISADVDQRLPAEERLGHALSDGEDFELLFCVSEADAARLQKSARPDDLAEIHQIGIITERRDVVLTLSGTERPLPADGWQHL